MPSGKLQQNLTGNPKSQVEDAKRKIYGTNIKTYSKGLASFLRSWTGVPRAEAGGPGVTGMPLAITV